MTVISRLDCHWGDSVDSPNKPSTQPPALSDEEISRLGMCAVADMIAGEGYTTPVKRLTAMIFEKPESWSESIPVYDSGKVAQQPREVDSVRAGSMQEMGDDHWKVAGYRDAVMAAEGRNASNIQGLLMSSRAAKRGGDLQVSKAILKFAYKLYPGLKSTLSRLREEGLEDLALVRAAATEASYTDRLSPDEIEFGICKANGVKVKREEDNYRKKKRSF